MCLPACLWAQIARTPFNYTNTARTLLAKCDDNQFQRLILQFLTLEKNYRIASMLIIIGALSAPRDVERRESGSMFCSTNHLLKFERIEQKAWKHSAEKYHDQTMGLSVGENPDKTRLTSSSFLDPLWFASLCWWPFFSLFSGALCISFSRCPSLDIRLFTYAFSCSLLRSSRCIQPVLATFLTFFRVFLGSLDAFYSSLSLVALSLSFQPIFTQTPFSTNLNNKNFLRLTKL